MCLYYLRFLWKCHIFRVPVLCTIYSLPLKAFLPDGVFLHRNHRLYFNIRFLCEKQIKSNQIICTVTRVSNSESLQRQANGIYSIYQTLFV